MECLTAGRFAPFLAAFFFLDLGLPRLFFFSFFSFVFSAINLLEPGQHALVNLVHLLGSFKALHEP